MFSLTRDPVAVSPITAHEGGGFVTFEGRVRNRNEGRDVVAVEYEAFEEMAVNEGRAIVSEAVSQYRLTYARAIHRVGLLRVGETAVWIEAAAEHRAEAFAACRAIIDAVKHRLPIWKKEYYTDGENEWVRCSDHCDAITPEVYYRRQTALPLVGLDGQRKLGEASVLVVGAGGLGCAALLYLAGAGVGRIGICEHDRLEGENLHRQVLYRAEDLGRAKGDLAAAALRALNPFIEVVTHCQPASDDTLPDLIAPYDVVLDCTDSFRTKFALNDACVAAGKPLVQASIYQFEGQVTVIDPAAGPGCLRCIWPNTPPSGCVGTCTEAGVLGTVPGLFGVLQATEAAKLLLRIGEPLTSSVLLFDLLTHETTRVARSADPNCPVCGSGPRRKDSLEVEWFDDLTGSVFIDIREPWEADAHPRPDGFRWICQPMSEFMAHLGTLDRDTRYVLVCSRGARSARLVAELRSRGLHNFVSLAGGIKALMKRCHR